MLDANTECYVLGAAQAQGLTTLASISCFPPTGLWNRMFPKREGRGTAVLLPFLCSVSSGNMDTLETWLHPIQSACGPVSLSGNWDVKIANLLGIRLSV